MPVAISRRELIGGLGSAGAWPLVARAQQPEHMRRIGVLMNRAAGNSEGEARVVAFQQSLQQLGWSDGRNMRMDIRWGRTMSTANVNTRWNWLRSRRMSSSPLALWA